MSITCKICKDTEIERLLGEGRDPNVLRQVVEKARAGGRPHAREVRHEEDHGSGTHVMEDVSRNPHTNVVKCCGHYVLFRLFRKGPFFPKPN